MTMLRRAFLAFATSASWKQVGVNDRGPSRDYLTAGPAPIDTVVDGKTLDAVVYLDAADKRLKIRKADGSIVVIG